ncbi:hypothetical protein NDU88_002921 [Pleurodeles waltl]|uniref:Uncharacterized protein n=1 Tax=Pleurodeles waltl TaxID=8319 RepID=A0AAV7VBY3_PLEWA|nr:hypothetical protein NDU88_002921 [Pleurodeles waltl]
MRGAPQTKEAVLPGPREGPCAEEAATRCPPGDAGGEDPRSPTGLRVRKSPAGRWGRAPCAEPRGLRRQRRTGPREGPCTKRGHL